MGVQMVSRGRYEQAIAILEAICVGYPFHESFIAGQVCPSSRVKYDKDTNVCAKACMQPCTPRSMQVHEHVSGCPSLTCTV